MLQGEVWQPSDLWQVTSAISEYTCSIGWVPQANGYSPNTKTSDSKAFDIGYIRNDIGNHCYNYSVHKNIV
jgi:hypothetical protein